MWCGEHFASQSLGLVRIGPFESRVGRCRCLPQRVLDSAIRSGKRSYENEKSSRPTVRKLQKWRERASRIWKALVVEISNPPLSFKPVSLFLPRSSLF